VRKPFHLDGLLKSLTGAGAAAASAPPLQALPWMNDLSKAAQHLTRLTLESSAQAALITRKNDLWAYAGGLSQNAAREIAQIVTRSWDAQRGSDLLRFIRLESTRAEHMLFATRLAADAVLALVFDAETPFSTIRSQANELITHISDPAGETAAPARSAAPSLDEFALDDSDETSGPATPPISEIITDVPSPNPEPATGGRDAGRDIQWPRRGPGREAALGETRASAPLSDATVFGPANGSSSPAEQASTNGQRQHLDEMDVVARARPRRAVAPIAPAEDGATRLSPTTEAARKVSLEPVSAGLYHLTYACLLVPRFASHYLTGDVSDRLSEWLPNICVAFGWRLEFLAVRPEYLQWVVNVQPNTSPGYVMRVMREQTSEKVFHAFPRKAKENPSGDFWAPGYLIMGGSQPHPPQLVRDYIRQIRERQGQESQPNP
jgi:REP element-mobilizing transposase RayT